MRLSIPVVSDKKVGPGSSVAWGSVRDLCQGGNVVLLGCSH
uniref:Regulator of sex limited protein 1 n=1 Tax=Mus musculus TaxID=10090 RepID=A0A286YDU4_MOUSE